MCLTNEPSSANPTMKAHAVSLSLALFAFRLARAQNVTATIPTKSPSSAVSVCQDLVAFSIEQDRWTDWIGTDTPNTFWLNALENLKQLSGLPTRLRIGADSEDHTNFSFDVEYATDIFPAVTSTVPYPEARNITAGQGFYNLAANLPSGMFLVNLNSCPLLTLFSFRNARHMGS